MGVRAAVEAELKKLSAEALASSEAQRAIVLASALDDRAGIQAGGLASTDKRLGELMAQIRELYKPVGKPSGLSLLRGDVA